MGTCPCWPKKRNNYDPYIEDYMEYDSPDALRYTPPSANSSANTQLLSDPTQRQAHPSTRPPDDSSTYSPPLPHQRQSVPPPSGSPTTAHPHQQAPFYTQYTESVYLSRNPNAAQPTASMLMDSMIDSSSILNPPNRSSDYHMLGDRGSSLVESNPNISEPAHSPTTNTTSTTFTTSSNNNFGAPSSNFAMGESNANLEASLSTSASSSLYYDAPGTNSYMMASVQEGAFEPPIKHSR